MTQLYISWWMDKQNMVNLYTEIYDSITEMNEVQIHVTTHMNRETK